ncbi:hypothetical protein [Pseudomonas ovata]|uniref:hypothetical protein n=1 Tax=Pseudomonas ovata TaxID=1839709 RepID=UPI0012601C3D|nr:hypothetical protein [Pseudomonas ovata]
MSGPFVWQHNIVFWLWPKSDDANRLESDMAFIKEMWNMLCMLFWTMVGLLMHLALIMVGAWVSYEVPDIDRETRTCLFLGWMAAQFLGAHLIHKRLMR